MLRVVGCIARDHDLGLVALACLVCVLAASTSVRLLAPARAGQYRLGGIRMAAAALAFSTGVWTTHFIGMLAFHSDMRVSFDVPLCIVSLLIAIVATNAAYAIMPREPHDLGRIAASGLVLAAGIGAMHFVGMRSMRMPGDVHYDLDLVAASLGLDALCCVAAMWLLARQSTAWAAAFLTLAVACTHFIAMGSITLAPTGGLDEVPLAIPRAELIMATGGACALILGLALTASILDQHFSSRLAMQARRFRTLADATFEGLIFERDGVIVDANRAMFALSGTDAASLLGRPLSELIPGTDIANAERGVPIEYEMRLAGRDTVPVEVLWRSGADRGERIIAIRDISRELAVAGRTARIVRFDPLTGLAKRELFEQQLHRALAASDRTRSDIGLLYVDLDRFETVIETLGHLAAEQILVEIARRLSAILGDTDSLARLGRDEFVIIRPLAGEPDALPTLASLILAEVVRPLTIDDQPIIVTASVGLAVYPADGAGGQDLLRNAVLAMRQAKNDGRCRWRYFEAGMDTRLHSKRSMENDLRIALKEEQLSLDYQPFVDTATLEIVGYEALLRWDHPERGRIPPADFIPLAEARGLIVPIGSWVLAAACAEAKSWSRPLIVSVNLSPAQFAQPGILDTVADVLRRTGLPPERLELEITEGTLMADTNNALRVLTALKQLGLKIAMDDFGTGYSSLSYLRKFPFDKIKIDRSFISGVEDDVEAETIVRAIIAMSGSLGLDVTAEGVETQEQLATLRALGCNFVQGYLLGRPGGVRQIGLHAAAPRHANAGDARVGRLSEALIQPA